MSSTLELDQDIVAIAGEDMNGLFHFFYCQKPVMLKNIHIHEGIIRIENFYIVCDWFKTIIICTEENLRELRQKLKNA